MANHPATNRNILTRKAYATDQSLSVRQRIHDEFSVPRINFPEWVLDRLNWRGDEHVLDIGSGPGTYHDAIRARIPRGRLVMGDLSLGMARKAALHPWARALNTDAQALPFARRSFDVVLANHVLYHVPDIDRALVEIRRVLRPTGCLLAATNSQFNMPELEQIIRRTFGLLGARNLDLEGMKPPQFYLEDGAVKVGRHFFAAARYDLPGAFIFPTADPVIAYVDSTRSLRESQLPRGIDWEDFMSVLGDQLQRIIAHLGEFVVSKLSGVIVGTDAGGFASGYVNQFIISRRKS